MKKKVAGKKKGITLLELIISIALVAVFVIPIGHLVFSAVKINKAGEDKQQAGLHLQEIVENIKTIDLPKNNGDSTQVIEGIYVTKKDNADEQYTIGEENNGNEANINSAKQEFSIEGTIIECVDENNNVGGVKVAGAIYYDGEDISVEEFKKDLTISEVVDNRKKENSGKAEENVFENSKNIEINVSGNIVNLNPRGGEKKLAMPISKDDSTGDESNILVYIRKKSELKPRNFTISVEDVYEKLDLGVEADGRNKLNIYIYNEDKISSRNDIIISSLKGNVEIFGGLKTDIKNMKIYDVNLKAMKGTMEIEEINFKIVR